MTEMKKPPHRPKRDISELHRRLQMAIQYYAIHQTGRITQRMILEKASVAKSTLNEVRDHPDIEPLVRQIEALTKKQRSVETTVADAVRGEREATRTNRDDRARGLAHAAGADSTSLVLDEVRIAGLYGQRTRSAIGAMGRFIGRHRRLQHVSALPATVRELELALRQLQAVLLDLRPLQEAWLKLPGATPDAMPAEQGLLDLDLRMPDAPANA